MKYLFCASIAAALLLAGFQLPGAPPVDQKQTQKVEAESQPEESATSKAQRMLKEDAVKRSDAMIADIKKAGEKYRCEVVPRIVIQGTQVSGDVVVVPKME